jgi:hypothetical protein
MSAAAALALALAGCAAPPPSAAPAAAIPAAAPAGCNPSAVSAAAAEAAQAGCGRAWIDANVRIHQIQSVGSHNSFKQAIPASVMALIAARSEASARSLDYAHRPLSEQLDRGARKLELDLHHDPEGGRFLDPLGPRQVRAQGGTPPAEDLSAFARPGIKVFHTPDIDYYSWCVLFTDCLGQVKAWSDANPDHAPILLMLNTKDSGLSWEGATPVSPFGAEAFEAMDREIASVFPDARIIRPDDVRKGHASLREAALAGAWPSLGEARGKVMFAIDNSPQRTAPYAEGRPSLEGRKAFINTDPEAPAAAYFTMNDSIGQRAEIQARVKAGFLVRTRADANTQEARTGDVTRREAAFASGAQWVSTDYQWPEPRLGSDYRVAIPGGAVARCNPVSAPPGCGDFPVE